MTAFSGDETVAVTRAPRAFASCTAMWPTPPQPACTSTWSPARTSALAMQFQAAAIGGRIAATAARSTHDLSPLHAKALSLHVVFMLIPLLENLGREDHGRIMREIAALAENGKVRPLVDPARFGLEQLPDAFRHLESGQALGKVVVDLM